MEIILDDWNDNSNVNYKLVIIKGIVALNGDVITNSDETIKCISDEESEWPVRHGMFKCLFQLSNGVNDIKLCYKSVEKYLRITYLPRDSNLCVVPVYVICKGHDGRFQGPEGCDNSVENACKKISLGAKLVQCVFGEKMRERGFKRKSFQLESDINDVPCRIFYSELDVAQARTLSEKSLWECLAREIMNSSLGNENSKYLAFLSCTYWNGTEVEGDVALGGGGLALLGTGCLHTWPSEIKDIISCFKNKTKVSSVLLDNSCFRGTFGGCFSTSLGSAIHELGHTFNLGHPTQGIMSRGFDYVCNVFTPEIEECNQKFSTDFNITINAPKKKDPNTMFKLDDKTFLTVSCATFLAYHKWFNDAKGQTCIEYNENRRILSSDAGLKVVQLRSLNGAVMKSWEFQSPKPHKQLILPRLKTKSTLKLVAIDSCGEIITLLD